MPTGKFIPVPVISQDGKNKWAGRGRKPRWLRAQEQAAIQVPAVASK